MVTRLSDARRDPAGTACALLRDGLIYGLRQASGRALTPAREQGEPPTRPCGAVFDLTLEPLPPLLADGYPVERLRLYVLDSDQALAVDLHPGPREYKHREGGLLKTLCLQYVLDDPSLQVRPEDGLEAYISCAYRHLMFEETWRRTGEWPAEDAPHGLGARPHPVRQVRTLRAALEWARQ